MTIIRTATFEDIPAIVRLVNSAYRGDYSKQGWTTEADILDGQRTDPESLKQLLQDSFNQLELAFDSQRNLVACVHVRKESFSTLYFGMLTVEPTMQGSGIGKKLLEHVENLAKDLKMSHIRMSVIHLRKELIAYYERRGYRATGKFEPFPENDPLYGLPKVKGIRLDEYVKDISTP